MEKVQEPKLQLSTLEARLLGLSCTPTAEIFSDRYAVVRVHRLAFACWELCGTEWKRLTPGKVQPVTCLGSPRDRAAIALAEALREKR